MRPALLASLLVVAACRGASPTAPASTERPPIAVGAIFITPVPAQLPAGGGTLELIIATATSDAGNIVAPRAHVALTTSGGALSVDSVDTDSSGHASVTWSGTAAATVTAQSGDVVGRAQIAVAPIGAPPPPPSPTPPPQPPPGPPLPPALVVGIDALLGTPFTTDTVGRFTARVQERSGVPVTDVSCEWDLDGDGSYETPSGCSVDHVYATQGRVLVTVHVVAADGRAGIARLPIEVERKMTVQLEVIPGTATGGALVSLIATASGQPPLDFAWDYNGDGQFDEEGPPTRDASFATLLRFPPGVWTITVRVRAGDGQVVTASYVLTVN